MFRGNVEAKRKPIDKSVDPCLVSFDKVSCEYVGVRSETIEK